MDFIRARESLQQTMEAAKQISKSLEKSDQKLVQIERERANLEYVMAPLSTQSKESKDLSDSVDRALEPTWVILKAMESIRNMETVLMDDPLKDLHMYAKTISDLEEFLSHINQKYPTMVEYLKGAIDVAGESRISDSYKMRVLNEALEGLEMVGPQTFMENGSELLASALKKLESAFMSVLVENSVAINLHGEKSSEKEDLVLTLDLRAVELINIIAEKLNTFGRGQKCLKMYWEVRIKILRDSFKSMETHYLRYDTAESVDATEWHDVEGYVADWLVMLKKTVKVLVSFERDFCCKIFETFGEKVWTECFGKLVFRSVMSALIEFGEAVALSQTQPEKLFKLLDMLEGLQSLKEDFGNLFEGSGCLEIRVRLQDLEKKLVHGACQVLRDFKGKIVEDAGISIDGTAPRIASYVVNYLKLMVTEYGKVMTGALEMEDSTSLAQNVSLVIDSLELNLRTRAKGYSETALADLFLMNSYWYIFKRARDSELGSVLGEPWLKQRRRLVNQHVLSYEKEKWGPLLKHLNRNGLVMSSGGRGGARDLFKQRLRAFNTTLETIYETHKSWLISEQELREATFVEIVQAVVPAYRSYIETFGHLLDQNMDGKKYLRYTPEQLESLLADLLTEKPTRAESESGKTKRTSSDIKHISI
ncbi:exocyst complex component EXO70A1 [Cryptomeria japonica]|uniref:exocyst complex component EXO70A1 n=1 Tax=Cryptomeria japonica TaxID=3369 RepID=UPI0027DA682B|nr:exocyst complex component EXO70A1 [Cryptomeria japonica]